MWAGIRKLGARDDKVRHYRDEDIHFGWFQAPYPFKKNAELPIIHGLKLHMQYPAVFVHDETDVDFWKVRCLAILLNRGKDWYAHNSRVILCKDDMSVIPPSLRPACEGGLVRGRGVLLCLLAAGIAE